MPFVAVATTQIFRSQTNRTTRHNKIYYCNVIKQTQKAQTNLANEKLFWTELTILLQPIEMLLLFLVRAMLLDGKDLSIWLIYIMNCEKAFGLFQNSFFIFVGDIELMHWWFLIMCGWFRMGQDIRKGGLWTNRRAVMWGGVVEWKEFNTIRGEKGEI